MNALMPALGHSTKSILSKIKEDNGRPPLIYFSSNTYSLNYYFIAKLFSLSQLYKQQEINIAIILNDMGTQRFQRQEYISTDKTTAKNIEVYKILNCFGVPSKNIKVHRLSEGWHNYLMTNEKAHFDFMHNLVYFDTQLTAIPEEETKLDFLPKNTAYEVYYVVQKYIDLIISSQYQKIFPDDFQSEVDIHLTSTFSYPLLQNIRADLIKRKNTYISLPKIYSLPPLPFFGKSKHIYPEHVVPNTEMNQSEIKRVIDIYNLDKKEIELIYKNFLIYALEMPHDLKLDHNIEQQRMHLAEDLYKMLRKIKNEITSTPKDMLNISMNSENSEELLSLLKSPSTQEILKLCNGENKIIDIAQKLNKHQPNVSKTISKLKKFEIIQINIQKKPIKTVNKIEMHI